MPSITIKLQPGALDNVPFSDLARFIKQHRLGLDAREDGLYITPPTSHTPAFSYENEGLGAIISDEDS